MGSTISTARKTQAREIEGWTEKQFQRQVVGLARILGWRVYHPYDSQRSTPGYPDLTLVHPRHGISWREIKTRKGPVSKHQREPFTLIEQARGDVAIWRPSDWTDRTIHDTRPRPVASPTEPRSARTHRARRFSYARKGMA